MITQNDAYNRDRVAAMINNIHKLVLAWSICNISGIQALPPIAQQKVAIDLTSQLNKKVGKYELDVGNFGEALVKVSSDFQIPMGIEWVASSNSRTRLKRSWTDTSAFAVLKDIVSTQPDYKIEVRANVVHVSSTTLVPDRDNPLKTVIPAYQVNNVPLEEASRLLHGLVRSNMKATKSPLHGNEKLGGKIGSLLTNPDEPRITVELHGTNVEECLDALTLRSLHKVWIVTFSANNRVDSTPFRRTSTLWNNYPIPDDDQPIWDLVRWGDTLPGALNPAE